MKRPIINSAEDSITELAVSGSFVSIVPSGSILCVVRSGILAHTFPVAVNSVAAAINQDMRALHPFPGVLARYVFYYLKFAQSDVLGTCRKHGTTVASIESSRLDDFPVPVCDERRQCGIVEAVDRLFAEIDDGEAALCRARADLEVYRRALLKAAVTGELTADWRAANPARETGAELLARILADRRARWHADPKAEGKGYREPSPVNENALRPLPPGWAWTKADTLVTWASGKFMPDRTMRPGTIPVYGGNGITGQHDEALHPTATLVIGRVGFYCGNAQVTAGPAWITDNAIYACRIAKNILPQFLQLAFECSNLRDLAQGGAQPFVSQALLNEVFIALPGFTEQQEIIRAMNSYREHSAAALSVIDDAASSSDILRQSILAAAFRGDLT